MNTIDKHIVRLILGTVAMLTSDTSATADMILRSSLQSISGMGTQLDLKEESNAYGTVFRDDLLHSGYVRDENNSIVGSVSSFASQSSAITESQIRGLGRGSGFAHGPAEGIGKSELTVEFHAENPMDFTLSGLLRLAPHALGLNDSIAFVSLTGPDGVVFDVRLDDENPPDGQGNVDFTRTNRLRGKLPVGDYMLEAVAVGHGSGGLTRCIDFDFTFNVVDAIAVPEPTSISMVAFLLGLMLAQSRRSRR